VSRHPPALPKLANTSHINKPELHVHKIALGIKPGIVIPETRQQEQAV